MYTCLTQAVAKIGLPSGESPSQPHINMRIATSFSLTDTPADRGT